MRKQLVRTAVLPIVLALTLVPRAGAQSSGRGEAVKPPARNPYEPARKCATCHQSIHKHWSESPHARSASSPAFLEAVRRAVEAAEDKAAIQRGCVWCHAPTTLLTGDFNLQQPVSREGITCDFCHTVADVQMERADRPFTMEPGNIKRGPFKYTKSPGHETAYSPLHRSSPLLCAACHETRNVHGVAVLSTYSEWKEGPYPGLGVSCQDCHMGLVPGTTVREDLKEANLRVVNLHRVVGGSALSQLNRGLELKIDSLARSSGSADIVVVVSNVAAGHHVPGGLSTKSLILAVGVETADGTFAHRQERVYRRELKDAQGRVLESVSDMFLRAASVGQDSRIKPKEVRRERFTVPIPAGAWAIVARLEYRDASDPREAPRTATVTEVRRDLSTR